MEAAHTEGSAAPSMNYSMKHVATSLGSGNSFSEQIKELNAVGIDASFKLDGESSQELLV